MSPLISYVQSAFSCALRSRILFTTAACLFVAGVVFLVANSQARAQQPKLVDAPELVGGTAWLNTDKAIKLEDLRGRIVLLDFWTLC